MTDRARDIPRLGCGCAQIEIRRSLIRIGGKGGSEVNERLAAFVETQRSHSPETTERRRNRRVARHCIESSSRLGEVSSHKIGGGQVRQQDRGGMTMTC